MHIRGGVFWGSVLILVAILLLLRQMEMIQGNIFNYTWALLIIFVGLWFIVSALTGRPPAEGEAISIPLEGATSAKISIDHGAGRLNIRSGAPAGQLMDGKFGLGLDILSNRSGDRLDVKMKHPHRFWTWSPGDTLDWDLRLSSEVPVSLDIDTGASATILDLSDLIVTDLDIDTGASSTELTLPANAGMTHAEIDTGVSSIKVRIPEGVAARIRVQSGIAAVNVDKNRFPAQGSGIYQSADYATAANRVDLEVETGVGAVEIA
ncbi:MAG: hypothetical protein JXB85_09765 [Anaerolineales bacterium]|nr:hypothetical protein [Anaerolineales bacterium]